MSTHQEPQKTHTPSPWKHPSRWLTLLVFLISLVTTYNLWRAEQSAARQELRTEFNFHVREVNDFITQRMQTYEQVLRGVAGLLSHSNGISRQEFHNYFDRLQLDENYPGIQGLSYLPIITQSQKSHHIASLRNEGFKRYTITPDGQRSIYTPVIYIEPFSGSNLRALGFDTYADDVRRTAMNSARDQDQSAISGKLKLIQETGDDTSAGFVMFLPIFRNGAPHSTLEERRKNITGWVSAPFRMDDLMSNLLGSHSLLLDFEIYDGDTLSPQAMLYDSDNNPGSRLNASFQSIQKVALSGHIWTVATRSGTAFEQRLRQSKSFAIAYTGLCISLLLAWLTWLLSSSRARALKTAHEMTRELSESKARYQQMFDEAASIAFLVDPDNARIVDANAAAANFWGYTLEELRSMKISQINTAPPDVISAVMQKVREGSAQHLEWQHRLKSGEIRNVEIYASPITHQGRTLLYSILHDITRRKQAELALQQALEFTEGIINAVPDLLFELDRDGRYLNIWAHDPQLLASQKELLLARTVVEMLPPDAAAIVMSAIAEADAKGESRGQVIRLDLPQGTSWFELSTVAKPASEASSRHFIMLSRDISERMRVESALRASEEKLRGLFELSPMGIALTDMQGHYLEFNNAFRDICGYTRDELNQLDYWALTPKEYADKEAEQLESLNSKGFYGPYEKEYIRKDGNRIPLRLNGVLIHDSSDKPYIWSIVEDITERKRAENTLRKLYTAVEQSAASIVITDLDANIEYVNPHFTKATGYTLEEVLGQNPRILQSGETPKETYDELWATLTSGKKWSGEFLDKRKNGEVYWEEVTISPIKNEHGVTTHYVGIKNEITARKYMEDALLASESHYRALVENAPFCIHEIDLQGRLQSMNRAGLEMMGLDDEQQIRDVPYLRSVSAPDLERIAALLKQAINGTPSHFEFIASGDAPLYFKSCFIPIKDADGNVTKLMGITENISERKQALGQMELLEQAVNASLDAVFLLDAQGRIRYVNDAACRSLGYSREELLRMTPPDFDPGTTHELMSQIMRNVRDHKIPPFETTHRSRDGRVFPVEISASSVEYAGEQLALAVARDVSERKQLEQKVVESEKTFQAVFEQAPDGVELIDPVNLRFVEANPAACRMLGYSHEEYLQLSLDDTQVDLHGDDLIAAVRQIEATGGLTFENRHRCKDGSILDVEVSAKILNVPGKPLLVGVWRDVTESKKAEIAIRESESKYRELFESAGDGIFIMGAKGYLDCNEKGAAMYGLSRAELLNRFPAELAPEIQPDGRLSAEVAQQITLAALAGNPQQFDWQALRADGTTLDVEINLARIEINGEQCLHAVVRDITERKRAEQNLRITASVFDSSQEAILITDANNFIAETNPAFTQITGYDREEVLGRNPKLLSSGRHDKTFYADMWRHLKQKKSWRGEIWNRRKTGEVYAELLSISVICDDAGRVQRHVAVFSDISRLKEHEAELSRIAHYDALTGLPNRMLLGDRMRQGIYQTAREKNLMAVCYLDLDGFKQINDTMGHEAGDQVLVEIAKRLSNTIRGADTAARLGGDEFVVLLLAMERGDECMATLERLLDAISQPMIINSREVIIGASVGVSIYPLDDEDPDTLLRHADQSMYAAKQSGKNRFHIYDPTLDQRARNQHEFLSSIRRALESNQFELHYQPKIDLNTRQMVGAEALIRWQHPERGLLAPAEFLSHIVNTELDVEVGEWVIATALAQINRWQTAGLDIEVSINISGYHLESPHFLERLRQQLAQYPDMPIGRLQIEVLETVALNDVAIVRAIIEECRDIGVGFALDDFGTGYSSLSYLSGLPVDTLKIDQSFVRDMLEDKGDMAIVHGIIALAQAFGRHTVAEGIETEHQFQALCNMSCEQGQGYFIARPMRADELATWQTKYHGKS